MDIFKQNKFLIRLVITLSLVNIISIGTILYRDFFRKPPPDNPSHVQRKISEILKKELNLSGKQVQQIINLRSGFFEKEKVLSEIIKSERDSMNIVMFSKTTNEELVKALAKRVADNEFKMEMLRFEQAKQFKAICTSDQLEKFERLILEIRDYLKPDEPRKTNH